MLNRKNEETNKRRSNQQNVFSINPLVHQIRTFLDIKSFFTLCSVSTETKKNIYANRTTSLKLQQKMSRAKESFSYLLKNDSTYESCDVPTLLFEGGTFTGLFYLFYLVIQASVAKRNLLVDFSSNQCGQWVSPLPDCNRYNVTESHSIRCDRICSDYNSAAIFIPIGISLEAVAFLIFLLFVIRKFAYNSIADLLLPHKDRLFGYHYKQLPAHIGPIVDGLIAEKTFVISDKKFGTIYNQLNEKLKLFNTQLDEELKLNPHNTNRLWVKPTKNNLGDKIESHVIDMDLSSQSASDDIHEDIAGVTSSRLLSHHSLLSEPTEMSALNKTKQAIYSTENNNSSENKY